MVVVLHFIVGTTIKMFSFSMWYLQLGYAKLKYN